MYGKESMNRIHSNHNVPVSVYSLVSAFARFVIVHARAM